MNSIEALEMFREINKRRGYIDIGTRKGTGSYPIGHLLDQVMQFDLAPKRFEVFAYTDASDWDGQNEEIAKMYPEWRFMGAQPRDGTFYRLKMLRALPRKKRTPPHVEGQKVIPFERRKAAR